MSQSITFQQFDKEKTDALWDDVLSGKYEKDVQQKKEELEKQLPALEAKIPKYTGEELDFMLYGKDPGLEEYDQAQRKFTKVKDEAFGYKLMLVGLNEFKERIQNKDKQEVLYAIEDMDSQLIGECGEGYSDNSSDIQFYTEILFKGVLGVDINEMMKEGEGFDNFPFDMWVKVFKQAEPAIMSGIKDAFIESDYSFEEFSRIMLQIKKVVKACLDTNTEMIAYSDTESSKFQKNSAKMLYDKVMNKKEEFLKPGLLEQ